MSLRSAMQYQKVSTQSGIEQASPHRLIQMLMEGALEKISLAKGHLKRGNLADKGKHISWAISIIGGLQGSLDKEKGGEISKNLDALYTYMVDRLFVANTSNDANILDEVTKLLKEVKEGWDGIEDEARQIHNKQKVS